MNSQDLLGATGPLQRFFSGFRKGVLFGDRRGVDTVTDVAAKATKASTARAAAAIILPRRGSGSALNPDANPEISDSETTRRMKLTPDIQAAPSCKRARGVLRKALNPVGRAPKP